MDKKKVTLLILLAVAALVWANFFFAMRKSALPDAQTEIKKASVLKDTTATKLPQFKGNFRNPFEKRTIATENVQMQQFKPQEKPFVFPYKINGMIGETLILESGKETYTLKKGETFNGYTLVDTRADSVRIRYLEKLQWVLIR